MNTLRIATWNANGLLQRKSELEYFIQYQSIDIALISETHFTEKTMFKIRGYRTYVTNHPSNVARGGSAVIIKESIQHHEMEGYPTEEIQATNVRVYTKDNKITVSAVYCPPKPKIKADQFTGFFKALGGQFIAGGDFNAKHTSWGSRLITPRGKELLKAINLVQAVPISSGKPTYWPSDIKKKPDLLDFFVLKGIAKPFMNVTNIEDLSADHIPVVLTLSTEIITKEYKMAITTKLTNWDLFREELNSNVKLKVRLKSNQNIEEVVDKLTSTVVQAAKVATPSSIGRRGQSTNYPIQLRELIHQKRKARRTWHRTQDPNDKKEFNKLCKDVKEKKKEIK